jgi:hypothetical protein
MKTAEEFLKEKNIDYSFFNTSLAKDVIKWMEEYAQQSTLNRDKVIEILDEASRIKPKGMPSGTIMFDKFPLVADAICSLSLPTLSEGEIYDKALLKYPRTTLYDEGKREGYIAALKELTKPKEEER